VTGRAAAPLLALLLALPAAACFAPSYESGHLACDPVDRCPAGFDCLGGRCWRHGDMPPPDDAAVPPDVRLPDDHQPPDTAAPTDTGDLPDVAPAPPDTADAMTMPPDAGGPLLASLTITPGTLDPKFDPEGHLYSVKLPLSTEAVTVRARPAREGVRLFLGGVPLTPSMDSPPVALDPGVTPIYIAANDGMADEALYTVYAQRGGVSMDLKASKVTAGDHFGRSIALSNDVLAVGAPDETVTGAVHVFVRSGGSWREQSVLKPTVAGGKFGASVAIFNGTLVVGAPADANSYATPATADQLAPGAGAVHIFVRTGGGWTAQDYVKPQVVSAGDAFGTSVAVDDDTVVIGAPGEQGSGTGVGADQRKKGAKSSGAVYVFTRVGLKWIQQVYIKASITKPENGFGTSVAFSGDTLIAGAPRQEGGNKGVLAGSAPPPPGSPAADNSGAAYVFLRMGETWVQQAWFKPSNTAAGFLFGSAVAITGDLVAVGAPMEHSASKGVGGDEKQSTTATASGAVYLFQRFAPGNWMQFKYVKASNTAKDDHFGEALSVNGSTLAVAAPGEDSASVGIGGSETDNGAKDSGAVYVFSLNPVKQVAYLKASKPRVGDAFGSALAVFGTAIAVGAPNQGDGAAASGAIYVY
jgi:hypothetical protein